MARWTRWTAKDSRGDYTEEESAVKTAVAGDHGIPALLFGEHMYSLRLLLFSYHPAVAAEFLGRQATREGGYSAPARIVFIETARNIGYFEYDMTHKRLCLRRYVNWTEPENSQKKRGSQMIKLYRDAQRPNNWVAYIPNSGWVAFPASENGWEHRAPARGLDPLFLREVPLQSGFAAGVPQPEFRKVA
jgi:hypothetical protein